MGIALFASVDASTRLRTATSYGVRLSADEYDDVIGTVRDAIVLSAFGDWRHDTTQFTLDPLDGSITELRLEPSVSTGDQTLGFVRATAQQLCIPDAPGNHRLDSLGNIVDTGRIGLLFLIPGVDETLRVNGRARLSDDAERLAPFAADPRVRLVIEVDVEEAYLHCAKALMRSKLWSDGARVERSVLPTMGQMISDQTGLDRKSVV